MSLSNDLQLIRRGADELIVEEDLARKLATLERKYDAQFKIVFDAIRELMTPPGPEEKRPIGFGP